MREGLGFDMNDPNLSDTPKRIALMWCEELFSSVGCEFGDITMFPNDRGIDEIIMSDKIRFTSTCSHHFLPFTGDAWVGYLPGSYLLGASKPARIVEHYSKRPQLQEHLTHEILECLEKSSLGARGIIVITRASHSCMGCRGVKQQDSGLIVSGIRGEFLQDPDLKLEALELIKISLLH